MFMIVQNYNLQNCNTMPFIVKRNKYHLKRQKCLPKQNFNKDSFLNKFDYVL